MEEGSRSCSSCSSDDDPFARRSVRRRYDNNPLPENFDLISNLPDSILIHILSSLPLTDVIATETLSKRWRFLWKMVPNLVFRHCASYPSSKPSALVSFIYKALLLHECSRIDEFSVGFEYRPKFRSAVDVWLHVAIGKNVEEINLDFPFYSYTLPQHLYTSSSLVKLTLTRCSMEEPRAVVSWPSLKILSIGSYPELNDSLIESILSGTPALESLELRECRGFSRLNITSASLKKLVINSWDVLQISAPKVESLSILGSTHEKKMSLNLPSLHFGTLNFELRVVEGDEDFKNSNRVSGRLMTNLLKTLNRVEELTLGNWCIQVLSVLDLQKLTAPICTCKRLILTSRFSRWDNPGIANLLRSSVSLETLVINITQPLVCIEILLQGEDGFRKLYKRNGKLDDKKHWNSQEGALLVNSLQHLKTVKIIDNIADRFLHQMQIELLRGVLQVILKNARELEKVVICTEMFENGVLINSIEVAHRLLSFPRASSSAVILCYNC